METELRHYKVAEPLPPEFNADLEVEVHTDKERHKLVACRDCGRPMAVTVFFAPAKAICRVCSPRDSAGKRDRHGAVGVVQPGKTDPAKAKRLVDCLINPGFSRASCPAHPDDDTHEMELKSVAHSPHYGPGYWAGKTWRQTSPGESVVWQCTSCNATVAYSTMQMVQFRCQNEPRERPDFGPPHRNSLLGVRGPDPTGRVA